MQICYLIFYAIVCVTVLKIGMAQSETDAQNAEWPPGWTEKCLGCMCEATTTCNQTFGCIGDFCGMFLISRTYWTDAGSPTLLGDDPDKADAFTRCVTDSYCASRTINQYIRTFIKDCNGDGTLSCDDYARLHYLGYSRCNRNIQNESYYRLFSKCFFRSTVNIV